METPPPYLSLSRLLGYLVFGRNPMWRPPSIAIPVKVIGLFGYLVKILDGNPSSLSKLLGFLVEILCEDPVSAAIHVKFELTVTG